MYKVFINDRPVILREDINNLLLLESNLNYKFKGKKELKQAIEKLYSDTSFSPFTIYHTSLLELWEQFQSLFKIIHAAGGLVLNKKDEILLIKRLGKWDLPKGKLESGEGVKEAAIREVEEECNVSKLTIIKELPTTYHIYSQDNNQILKHSHWFEMKCDQDEFDLQPQEDEGITEVKWVKQSEMQNCMKNTYSTIKDTMGYYLSQ